LAEEKRSRDAVLSMRRNFGFWPFAKLHYDLSVPPCGRLFIFLPGEGNTVKMAKNVAAAKMYKTLMEAGWYGAGL
jgi:hypothetical protein